ncbi:multidrug MFS transporter [bacterium SCGC AG-212-C10]|nr:multidrug MFS transporter [bacterium SCGC AG-212-C10]
MPPTPFRIDVPQSVLDDLKERLGRTRWAEPIPGVGWDYGADAAYIKELCEYWRDGYDWRLHEGHLNRYPQFLSTVDGVDLHYWHIKGKGPNPFPLIMVHGWPGSIFEFYAMIGRLTDPAAHGGDAADAFDLVIPALPGYGFGGKPQERGWGPSRTAKAFDTLMVQELGYDRYGTQGGDWGGIITARMGLAHPEHIAGLHVNFVIAQPPQGKELTAEEQEFVAALQKFQADETGYSLTHSTKPMSLAIAQADSPAGIAAWIVEKFRTWSDCNGDVESVYSKDQLLTNIMFYWAPNSIGSAANMYYESRRDQGAFGAGRIEVPVGVASFPKEIYRPARAWAEARYNITRWTEFDKGGHFAALERPKEMVDDIRAFFRTVRQG